MSASSLARTSAVTPQEIVLGIHGKDAARPKADLNPKASETALRTIAKDVIQAGGKQEAAAEEAGLSGGRFSAKLIDGSIRLRELERLGPSFAVKWAEEIIRQFGPTMTPQQFIREEVRAIRKHLENIEQGTEATE